MGSNLIYGFDKQRKFKSKYMAKNIRSSGRQRRHDENSMSGGGSSSAKAK